MGARPTDFPLWPEGPHVADGIEVRRGHMPSGTEVIVLYNPKTEAHVAIVAAAWNSENLHGLLARVT